MVVPMKTRNRGSAAVYCTTYCNHGHRLADGKPVGHECHIIPPRALAAEMDGDIHLAIQIIERAKNARIV
jgi:hypothetical protein